MTTMTCDQIRDLAPAYVLGALERDEELAVAEHLRTCPDAHVEFLELGGVVPYLDEAVPLVEPPAALRGRIMAAAAADLAARSAEQTVPALAIPAARPGAGNQPPPGGMGRIIPIAVARNRPRRTAWVFGLAAVLAIVAMGAWNVRTQQQLADARSYQERLAAALMQAGQPGSQVAVLASTGGPGPGPGGIAVMPSNGFGILVVSGLAPTTGGQVYEAWTIVEGQPPVPVAGFTVGADGIGYLDRMPTASGQTLTVAITLEPAPDPAAPSSAPVAAGVAAQRGVGG